MRRCDWLLCRHCTCAQSAAVPVRPATYLSAICLSYLRMSSMLTTSRVCGTATAKSSEGWADEHGGGSRSRCAALLCLCRCWSTLCSSHLFVLEHGRHAQLVHAIHLQHGDIDEQAAASSSVSMATTLVRLPTVASPSLSSSLCCFPSPHLRGMFRSVSLSPGSWRSSRRTRPWRRTIRRIGRGGCSGQQAKGRQRQRGRFGAAPPDDWAPTNVHEKREMEQSRYHSYDAHK